MESLMQSNTADTRKKLIYMVLGTIIVILVVLIVTGIWRPFEHMIVDYRDNLGAQAAAKVDMFIRDPKTDTCPKLNAQFPELKEKYEKWTKNKLPDDVTTPRELYQMIRMYPKDMIQYPKALYDNTAAEDLANFISSQKLCPCAGCA